MGVGRWIVRLDPEAAAGDRQALGAMLRRAAGVGGVVTGIDEGILDVLAAGQFPAGGPTFPVRLAEEDDSWHARVYFRMELQTTNAAESLLDPRGVPDSKVVKEIRSAAEWAVSDHPHALLLGRWRFVSCRKHRLFGCACCRHAWDALTDARSRRAVTAAEEYADGTITAEDLAAAHEAARAACQETPSDPDSLYSLARWAASSAANPINACVAASSALIAAAGSESCAAMTRALHASLVRDIVGNPFRQVSFSDGWRSADVLGIARGIYADRAFDRMPILADALMDAGCDDEQVLSHSRDGGQHARGCWVVDLVLGLK